VIASEFRKFLWVLAAGIVMMGVGGFAGMRIGMETFRGDVRVIMVEINHLKDADVRHDAAIDELRRSVGLSARKSESDVY